MHNWDDFRIFLAVVRHNTFSLAADALKINPSTVGRRIDHLEERLNSKLFDRSRKGMTLTAAGRQLAGQVGELEQAVLCLEDSISATDQDASGLVKISATDGIASFWLTPNLVQIQSKFPNISIELLSETKEVDLLSRAAHIAVRLTESQSPEILQQRVGTVKFEVFASPKYVEKFGVPKDWGDLQGHRIVDYTGYGTSKALGLWQRTIENQGKIVLTVNSAFGYVQALRSGAGLGMLPKFYEHAVSDLTPLDLDTDLFEMPVYLISHANTKHLARVDLIKQQISQLFARDRRAWFS